MKSIKILAAAACCIASVAADECSEKDQIITDLQSAAEKIKTDATKERESLLESRRTLASELSVVKEEFNAEKIITKKLTQKIDSMTITVESLGTCEATREELASKAAKDKSECEAAIRMVETNHKKKMIKMEAKVDEVTESNKRLSNALAEKSREEFLFSFEQLRRGAVKFYRFMRCVTIYAYEAVMRLVPPDLPAKTRKMLGDYGVVRQYESVRLVAASYWGRLENHPATIRTIDSLKVLCSHRVKQLMTQNFRAAMKLAVQTQIIVLSQLAVFAAALNRWLNTALVPLEQRFPEMRSLLPLTPLDRFVCITYATIVTMILTRSLLCLLCRMTCGMCRVIGVCCCSIAGTTSDAKKAKRPRKPFQPAAVVGTSTTKGTFVVPSPEKEHPKKKK